MKKFLKLSALLITVMSVLFLGCSSDGGGGGSETGGDVAVVSIAILVNGTQVANPPYSIYIDDTAALSALVLPANATEKGYDFTLEDNDGVLSLSSSNVLSALKAGTATIKVTSKGKKADDTFATASLSVVVTENPEGITTAELVVINQNSNTDSKTTTSLPALNADKRYVIVNNEATANLPNEWANVAGNTIVYLNKPLKIQSEVSGTGDTATVTYTPYSISARVRITGGRDTPALSDTANCLITGIFTNPTLPVTTNTPLYFVGMRHAWSGQKRMYVSSSSANAGTAFSSTGAPDFDKADTDATKKSGFQEQEYVVKVERTTAAVYTLFVYKADGTTLIASNTRGSLSNQVNAALQKDDDFYYLGFIVSGVTVEISNIVVKDGTETVFQAATDAVPDTVAVKSVSVTATNPVGADANYNYQCIIANYPTAGVQLNAQVVPTDAAAQNVTWSIDPSANGTVTSGLVKITTAGVTTVKAQSTDDNTKYAEFKFNVLATAPNPTAVHVSGHNSVLAGETINNLTASVLPTMAVQTVTWSVTANDGSTTTTAATIDTTTGVLTAASNVYADTVVNVFATSTTDSSIKSTAHLVTIKPSGSGPTPPQIWLTNIGDAKGTASVTSGVLTLTGTGSINNSGQVFSFVYLPVSGDFTMMVKLLDVSFGTATSNAGRVGLIAISQSSASVQNTTTGELTGVATDTTLNFAGATIRADKSWGRHSRSSGTGNPNWTAITGTGLPTDLPTESTPTSAIYMKLRRSNDSFTMSHSTDGETWAETSGTVSVTLGDIYVGFEASCASSQTATVKLTDWRILVGNGNASKDELESSGTEIDLNWLK